VPAHGASPCDAPAIDLYGTFEAVVNNPRDYKNPFDYDEISLEADIQSPDGRLFTLSGFYDGAGEVETGPVWLLRMLADHPGTWRYSYRWSDDSPSGEGCFNVDDKAKPKMHGLVGLDPENRSYLIHADGTPHYWVGGKWMGASRYGPPEKHGEENDKYFTDFEIIQYFDLLETYDHNGILVSIGLFPLENDKISWDLRWIRRAEWVVEQAARRGIYAQVTIFDTWSRSSESWFQYDIDGRRQVFNVWDESGLPLAKNYIRTAVARFAGYANVYWELGNEMGHEPNDGAAFVRLANLYYLRWIRQYDPYDRPIGLSETDMWRCTSVDIGFEHQTDRLPGWSEDGNPLTRLDGTIENLFGGCTRRSPDIRPIIMNELVRGGDTGDLWRDSVIRDPASRYSYRRAFWLNFTYGGSGASEATALRIDRPPNEAILKVMSDHERLRTFINDLPVSINKMEAVKDWVVQGPPRTDFSRTRRKEGQVYVTYLRASGQRSVGRVVLSSLPRGRYRVDWIDPTSLQSISEILELSGGTNIGLDHPAFVDDLVLLVTRRLGESSN